MNKKSQAGNFTMIIAFVFLLIIIGVGIVAGIYVFFGSEYDFRQIDAVLLNHKITKCLTENNLDFSLTREEIEKQFFETCPLNEDSTKENYLIFIKQNNAEKFKWGLDETKCALGETSKNYPKCINSTITKDNSKIYILTGSNQWGRKKIT